MAGVNFGDHVDRDELESAEDSDYKRRERTLSGPLAQLVERHICNVEVGSSILPRSTAVGNR